MGIFGGATWGAVSSTHSCVSIEVSRLSSVPSGRWVVSRGHWTRKFLIVPPGFRCCGFRSLGLILFDEKRRCILK